MQLAAQGESGGPSSLAQEIGLFLLLLFFVLYFLWWAQKGTFIVILFLINFSCVHVLRASKKEVWKRVLMLRDIPKSFRRRKCHWRNATRTEYIHADSDRWMRWLTCASACRIGKWYIRRVKEPAKYDNNYQNDYEYRLNMKIICYWLIDWNVPVHQRFGAINLWGGMISSNNK